MTTSECFRYGDPIHVRDESLFRHSWSGEPPPERVYMEYEDWFRAVCQCWLCEFQNTPTNVAYGILSVFDSSVVPSMKSMV